MVAGLATNSFSWSATGISVGFGAFAGVAKYMTTGAFEGKHFEVKEYTTATNNHKRCKFCWENIDDLDIIATAC